MNWKKQVVKALLFPFPINLLQEWCEHYEVGLCKGKHQCCALECYKIRP